MSTGTYLRSAAALFTAISLLAAPASAQRRHEEGSGRRDGGDRSGPRSQATPRTDGGSRQRDAQPRREAQSRSEDRRDNRGDNRRWDGARADRRDDGRDSRRAVPYRYEGRRDDRRAVPYRGDIRPRVVVPQYRSYGYRTYPRRTYVVPYGYRPYGYRSGWSVDLYFGRPYGYADRPYGYYSLAPGYVYGSLRIVDAPRNAQVFVDGYYAGVVDEYDGVFQHLNLEPGAHHIEIEVDPGSAPIAFDVRIEPGRTMTFHARDYY